MDARTSPPRPGRLQLAPGYRLHAGSLTLHGPAGPVPLNPGACRLLALCDGTQDAGSLGALYLRQAGAGAALDDVREFLAAALARGWLRLAG